MSGHERGAGPPIDPRLLRRVPAVRGLLAGLGVAWVIDAALLVVQAVAVGTAVATLAGDGSLGEVAGSLAVVAVAGVARAAVGTVREAATAGHGARVRAHLRAEATGHVLRHGGTDRPSGEVAAALGHGFDALDGWFTGFVPALVGAVVVPPVLLGWMLWADPLSGLVVALTVPLVPVFMVLVGRRAQAWADGQFATLERLAAHVVELLRGLPMLWMLRRERPQEQVLATVGGALRRTTMAGLRVAFLSAFVLELVAMLGTAVVAVTLGLRLVAGTMGLATAFAVLLVTPEVYARLREVGVRFHASREGSLAAARVLDLLDTKPRPAVAGTRPVPDPRRVPLVVDGATVVAVDREDALRDVTVVVAPGRMTAVTGPSGAGKTTLARLLAGVQRPEVGTVRLGSVGLTALAPHAWRRRVAWVPSWPVVMAGTLREGLCLGLDRQPTPDELWAVLAAVGADAWVASLPAGLDTPVGPGARPVSGGERTRLGLARALLRHPDLLVVDEPTAHLDPASAAAVGAALVACRDRGATVVVVTHDDALAARADAVVRVAAGRVRTGAPAAAQAGATTREVRP